MTINLSDQFSISHQFLFELRSTSIQPDRQRFRHNVERMGEIMAYEISKKLEYSQMEVNTPLGKASCGLLKRHPVLITILRAGLPYWQGFQRIFDKADCGFIGAYRTEDSGELSVKLDYIATPSLQGQEIILIDPMLATGRSAVDAFRELVKRGEPSHLHLAALIAAPEGIKYVSEEISCAKTIWTFAVDEKLNQQFYIVPGLGDAGDLSYGTKL